MTGHSTKTGLIILNVAPPVVAKMPHGHLIEDDGEDIDQGSLADLEPKQIGHQPRQSLERDRRAEAQVDGERAQARMASLSSSPAGGAAVNRSAQHGQRPPYSVTRVTSGLNATLVAVIEMSQSSWLVAGTVPGIDRRPQKKIMPDEMALLRLLHRWRDEATRKGRVESSNGLPLRTKPAAAA